MGDMNEYTEDTLRATVQAAELAIRDSGNAAACWRKCGKAWGLPRTPASCCSRRRSESWRERRRELLAELRRMRSSQPTQGEQGTRPRRPTPMRGLLI